MAQHVLLEDDKVWEGDLVEFLRDCFLEAKREHQVGLVLEGGCEFRGCLGSDDNSPPGEMLEMIMGPFGDKDERGDVSICGEEVTDVLKDLSWKVGELCHDCEIVK